MDAETLFQKYSQRVSKIIQRVKKDGERATPYIISKITTEIIPAMMQDVGSVKGLSGADKKQLVIDALEMAIDETFRNLNRLPKLARASWDEDLKLTLLTLTSPTIDQLINVEQGQLKFNSKPFRFPCCQA